ncbi:MAG: leucyl/phenylalanyl-tRNA--protein transferase [Halioglobus sp.]
MPLIPRLAPGEEFPPSDQALDSPNGLLAVGGDLSPARLIAAYRRGIFPWYEEEQPVLWWTPDPRSVLLPEEFHISRSLRKTLRRNHFQLSVDSDFATVMTLCGETRADGPGTWIGPDMLSAYTRLHEMGVAHSIEVGNLQGQLVGGLYGVALGGAFFGESMFSLETNASKVAMVGLVNILARGGFQVIDCQVESEHLNSLGARNLSRLDFEELLAHTIAMETDAGIWRLPATSGDLL